MRAFFAHGVETMHVPLAVQTLLALLHLSLFIFFAGLIIFSFNVNHSVFATIAAWIALFLTVYGIITFIPILKLHSPYIAPFSSITWSVYIWTLYALSASFAIIMWQTSLYQLYFLFRNSRERYHSRKSVGIEKAAEETAMKPSSETDFQILDWTLSALVDDESLGKYFRNVPGFVKSKIVNIRGSDISDVRYIRFWDALGGFLRRTLSINGTDEAIKVDRLAICMDAASVIPCPSPAVEYICRIIDERLGQVPLSIETGHALARRFTNDDGRISQHTKYFFVKILTNVTVQNPDDRSNALALIKDQLGLPKDDHGNDSASLSILIHMTRQVIYIDVDPSNPSNADILSSFCRFDINNAIPELRNEFCSLWNEIVQKAEGGQSHYVRVLRAIRHLYIALHRGTDAAPTAFDASTAYFDSILDQLSSYPSCNEPSHHPNSPDPLPRPRQGASYSEPRPNIIMRPRLTSSNMPPYQGTIADVAIGPLEPPSSPFCDIPSHHPDSTASDPPLSGIETEPILGGSTLYPRPSPGDIPPYQGTDVATGPLEPLSYPFCNIPSHHPDSTASDPPLSGIETEPILGGSTLYPRPRSGDILPYQGAGVATSPLEPSSYPYCNIPGHHPDSTASDPPSSGIETKPIPGSSTLRPRPPSGYIPPYQGTDVATGPLEPPSYPFCNIPSHRPEPTASDPHPSGIEFEPISSSSTSRPRHPPGYIPPYQGTDVATGPLEPLSYPFCNISSHHPDSTTTGPLTTSRTVLQSCDPYDVSHPSHLEILPIPGGSTAPQRVEEVNISGLPSSTDDAPPHSQGSSPSSTTDPVHVPQ
jgi:hypothetical protein